MGRVEGDHTLALSFEAVVPIMCKVKKRAFPVGRGQDFCDCYLSCLVLKACGLIAGNLAGNHNGVIWSHFRPSSEVPGACTLHA